MDITKTERFWLFFVSIRMHYRLTRLSSQYYVSAVDVFCQFISIQQVFLSEIFIIFRLPTISRFQMRMNTTICLFFALLQISLAFLIPQRKTLKEGVELITDVENGEEQRFHIQRANESEPVFIHVTPCGGAVHWSLYHVNFGLHYVDRIADLSTSPLVELIAGEANDRRMTFYSHQVPEGSLILVLESSSVASARVFLSSSDAAMDEQYPRVPRDSRLAYSLRKRGRETSQAVVTWKLSQSVRSADANRYRVCGIVSRRKPNWALCDMLQEGLESIHCVSNTNNSMIFNNLRSGRKYYITVFIRDALHGTTSSYETLEINTRKRAKTVGRKPRGVEVRFLPDSVLKTAQLGSRKGTSLSYFYTVMPHQNIPAQKVLLVAHACNGPIRLSVYRNGRLLRKTEPFSGYRRFLIGNVRSGQLRFEVSNDNNEAKSVRLWASNRPEKSPYPMLPEDTSVKVAHRSKNSVTLQWLRASDIRAEYCIYKRRENTHYLEHLVSRVDNLCEGGLSSELVGCYQHKGIMSKTITDPVGVIETTIQGLNPSTTYRFDLLATPLRRKNAQSLPYRTVWIRTLPF